MDFTTDERIIAVAVAIYGLIQLLKKFPLFQRFLQGWFAILVNAVFSIVGVIAITPPGQLFTIDTIMHLIEAFGVAAGIHGTVYSIQHGGKSTPSSEPITK